MPKLSKLKMRSKIHNRPEPSRASKRHRHGPDTDELYVTGAKGVAPRPNFPLQQDLRLLFINNNYDEQHLDMMQFALYVVAEVKLIQLCSCTEFHTIARHKCFTAFRDTMNSMHNEVAKHMSPDEIKKMATDKVVDRLVIFETAWQRTPSAQKRPGSMESSSMRLCNRIKHHPEIKPMLHMISGFTHSECSEFEFGNLLTGYACCTEAHNVVTGLMSNNLITKCDLTYAESCPVGVDYLLYSQNKISTDELCCRLGLTAGIKAHSGGIILSSNIIAVKEHIKNLMMINPDSAVLSDCLNRINTTLMRKVNPHETVRVCTLGIELLESVRDAELVDSINLVLKQGTCFGMWQQLTRLKGLVGEKALCDIHGLPFIKEDDKSDITSISQESEVDFPEHLHLLTPDAYKVGVSEYPVEEGTMMIDVVTVFEFGWVTRVEEKLAFDKLKWNDMENDPQFILVQDYLTNRDARWDGVPPELQLVKNFVQLSFTELRPIMEMSYDEDLYSTMRSYDFRSRRRPRTGVMNPGTITESCVSKATQAVGYDYESRIREGEDISVDELCTWLEDAYDEDNIKWCSVTSERLAGVIESFIVKTLSGEFIDRLSSKKHFNLIPVPVPQPDTEIVKLFKKVTAALPQKRTGRMKQIPRLSSANMFHTQLIWALFKHWGQDFFITSTGKYGRITEALDSRVKALTSLDQYMMKAVVLVNCNNCWFSFGSAIANSEVTLKEVELCEKCTQGIRSENPLAESEWSQLTDGLNRMNDAIAHLDDESEPLPEVDIDDMLDFVTGDPAPSMKPYQEVYDSVKSWVFGTNDHTTLQAQMSDVTEYLAAGSNLTSGVKQHSCLKAEQYYNCFMSHNIGFLLTFYHHFAEAFIRVKAEHQHVAGTRRQVTNIGDHCLVMFSKAPMTRPSCTFSFSSDHMFRSSIPESARGGCCAGLTNHKHILLYHSAIHLYASYLMNADRVMTGLSIETVMLCSMDLIIFLLADDKQQNIVSQASRYFIMAVCGDMCRLGLGDKLSGNMKKHRDLFLIRPIVKFYSVLTDIRAGVQRGLKLDQQFDQPLLYCDCSVRAKFDGLLLSMYTHHLFVKWFSDLAPEMAKVYQKFAKPILSQEQMDPDRVNMMNGMVSGTAEEAVHKLARTHDGSTKFDARLLSALYRSYDTQSAASWKNENSFSTPVTHLCNSNSTIRSFSSGCDFKQLVKLAEHDAELSALKKKQGALTRKEVRDEVTKILGKPSGKPCLATQIMEGCMKPLCSSSVSSQEEGAGLDADQVEYLAEEWLEGKSVPGLPDAAIAHLSIILRGYKNVLRQAGVDRNMVDVNVNQVAEVVCKAGCDFLPLLSQVPLLMKCFVISAMGGETKLDELSMTGPSEDLNVIIIRQVINRPGIENLFLLCLNRLLDERGKTLHDPFPQGSLLAKKAKNPRAPTTDLIFDLVSDDQIDCTNLTMYEIAKRMGFNDDPTHFAIAAKQQLGGSRELSISTLKGKVEINCVETVSRCVSKHLPESCLDNKRKDVAYSMAVRDLQKVQYLKDKAPIDTLCGYEPVRVGQLEDLDNHVRFLDDQATSPCRKYCPVMSSTVIGTIKSLLQVVTDSTLVSMDVRSKAGSILNLLPLPHMCKKACSTKNPSSRAGNRIHTIINTTAQYHSYLLSLQNTLVAMSSLLSGGNLQYDESSHLVLFESSDHKTWGPNLHPMLFTLIPVAFGAKHYVNMFRYVLAKHMYKQHEIPIIIIARVMKKFVLGLDMLPFEDLVLRQLKASKPYTSTTRDMGQGMLHYCSDVYGAIVTEFSSSAAVKFTAKKFSLADEDLSYDNITSSDDHSAILKLRQGAASNPADVFMCFLNYKWYVQEQFDLFCSEKSTAGRYVCEMKSCFTVGSNSKHPTIKFTSSQLMAQRTISPESEWMCRASYAKACLAEDGNLAMGQMIMNAGNHLSSSQFLTNRGGQNRLPGHLKYMVPPSVGGYPVPGVCELYLGLSQMAWFEFVETNNAACNCGKRCIHSLARSIAWFASQKPGVSQLASCKEDSLISGMMGVTVLAPRRLSEMKHMRQIKEASGSRAPERDWLKQAVDVTYNGDLASGLVGRVSQAFFSSHMASFSNASVLFIHRKKRHVALGQFHLHHVTGRKLTWEQVMDAGLDQDPPKLVDTIPISKLIRSLWRHVSLNDERPVTVVKHTHPTSHWHSAKHQASLMGLKLTNSFISVLCALVDEKKISLPSVECEGYLNMIPHGEVKYNALPDDMLALEKWAIGRSPDYQKLLLCHAFDIVFCNPPGSYSSQQEQSLEKTLAGLIDRCTLPASSLQFEPLTECFTTDAVEQAMDKVRVLESVFYIVSFSPGSELDKRRLILRSLSGMIHPRELSQLKTARVIHNKKQSLMLSVMDAYLTELTPADLQKSLSSESQVMVRKLGECKMYSLRCKIRDCMRCADLLLRPDGTVELITDGDADANVQLQLRQILVRHLYEEDESYNLDEAEVVKGYPYLLNSTAQTHKARCFISLHKGAITWANRILNKDIRVLQEELRQSRQQEETILNMIKETGTLDVDVRYHGVTVGCMSRQTSSLRCKMTSDQLHSLLRECPELSNCVQRVPLGVALETLIRTDPTVLFKGSDSEVEVFTPSEPSSFVSRVRSRRLTMLDIKMLNDLYFRKNIATSNLLSLAAKCFWVTPYKDYYRKQATINCVPVTLEDGPEIITNQALVTAYLGQQVSKFSASKCSDSNELRIVMSEDELSLVGL